MIENQNNPAVVSTTDWIITRLITAIPIVGLIMLFVWAFGSDTNPNKANWAKAMLIWMLIGISISIFVLVIFGTAIFAAMSNLQGI